MTLTKVSSGEPLRIPADTFNAFVDAAAAYQADRLAQGVPGQEGSRPAGVILLRNDSGAARSRFDILTLGNPLILPGANLAAFHARVAFRGVSPDATKPGRFAVLQEPIAAGGTGRACIDGITPVQVDMVSATDTAAEVVTGQTGGLRSGATGAGSAHILWAEPGTGARRAVVRLRGPGGTNSASGERVEITVTQPAHGFQVGYVVYADPAGRYAAADVDVLERGRVVGVVRAVADLQTFTLVLSGRVSDFLPSALFYSLVPGTTYYLKPGVPGAVTADPGLNPIPVFATGAVATDIIIGSQPTLYRPGVVHRVYQPNHRFTVGTVIAGNASALSFTPAMATPGPNSWAAPVGVVSAVIDPATFAFVSHGMVSGLGTLQPYTTYYLSETTPGGLTATPPLASIPIGISLGSDVLFVQIQQPMPVVAVGNPTQNGILRVRGRSGNAVVIDASVVTAANRALRLREVDVCSGGVARKMLILASDPY